MRDPNLIFSGLGKRFVLDGVTFTLEIYRLETSPTWTMEVIDKDGTSIVWDDAFESDQAAMDEFDRTVSEEGIAAFKDNNVIKFPKKR